MSLQAHITDANLGRSTRLAKQHCTKDILSTRRATVHNNGLLYALAGLLGCLRNALKLFLDLRHVCRGSLEMQALPLHGTAEGDENRIMIAAMTSQPRRG